MTEFKDIFAKDVHAQLIQQMRTGTYSTCDQLPRESELAKVMGISRTSCGIFWLCWNAKALSPAATVWVR